MRQSIFIKCYFLNTLIWRGNKLRAERFYHELIFRLKKLNRGNPFNIFYFSLFVLRPVLVLRSIRSKKKGLLRVPKPITEKQKNSLAVKFLIFSSRNKSGVFSLKLLIDNFFLLYASLKNPAIEKKAALYKEALAGRVHVKTVKLNLRNA